jgi:hypothetical protein
MLLGVSPHVPALQTGSEQGVGVMGAHSALFAQPVHAPFTQEVVAPQSVPFDTGVKVGVPAVHESDVQALPSLGVSVGSAIEVTLPAPSQTFFWQSPVVCEVTAVFAATKLTPHVFAMQVRLPHSESVPVHSEGSRHSTHWPWPLQKPPMHGMPTGSGVKVALPYEHPVSMQSVAGGGSVGSAVMVGVPMTHTILRQLPEGSLTPMPSKGKCVH